MFQERKEDLASWIGTPPSEIAFSTGSSGMIDEDVDIMGKVYPSMNRAIERAGEYSDLDGVFAQLLTEHNIIISYLQRFRKNPEPGIKLQIRPKENVSDLGIHPGCGFFSFVDCLAFAAQSFLAGQEGFGLPSGREVVETNIDTWLRKRHRVWLSKDGEEGKLILEAQREWDHHPVLRVKGGNFSESLLVLDARIIDDDILSRAEDIEFMFEQDGNTPVPTIEIEL